MFLWKSNTSTNCALPSLAVDDERDWSTPSMPCSARSMRLTISRSTVSGDAPG